MTTARPDSQTLRRQMVRGLRGLLAYLWMYRPLVLAGILSLVLSDVFQLLVPLFAGRLVDGLSAGTTGSQDIARTGWILLGLAAGTALTRFGWRHFLFQASRLAEVDLRRRLLDRTLALPTSHFATTSTGEIMALATNDVASIRMALSMGLVAAFDASVFALVALAAMAALDLRLTLWTILPFPILAVVMLISLRMIYERYDRVQSVFEDLTEKVRESLAGIRVLRAYGQEAGDAADFETYNATYHRSYLDYVRVDSLFRPAIMGLAGLSSAILLGVGGARVIQGQTSLGDFTAFSVYLGMLIWPMIAAGWMVTLIQRGGGLDVPSPGGAGPRAGAGHAPAPHGGPPPGRGGGAGPDLPLPGGDHARPAGPLLPAAAGGQPGRRR